MTLPGSTTPTTVGQIGLTRFINKAGLQADRRQSVPGHARLRRAAGRHRQHRWHGRHAAANLEQANVEVVSEISDLIAAQRAYEMNAKVISAADQMLQATPSMFR